MQEKGGVELILFFNYLITKYLYLILSIKYKYSKKDFIL